MPDASVIKQLFSHYGIVNQTEMIQPWLDNLTEVQVTSGETLVRVGDQQDCVYLIVQGIVRYYYLLPDGKEWNKAFFCEGRLIGSLNALLTQAHCPFSIEALEDCTLYRIPIECFDRLPHLSSIQQQLTQELFLRNESREAVLLTGDAEARYHWLEQHEPWLLKRSIPQYHLASYLGMDAVSLSRLKRKLKQT